MQGMKRSLFCILSALVLLNSACRSITSPVNPLEDQTPAESGREENGGGKGGDIGLSNDSKEVNVVREEKERPDEKDEKRHPSAESEDIPAPLSHYQILRQIGKIGEGEWYPLQNGKQPVAVLYDVDRNGYTDAVSLFIHTEEEEEAEVEKLSDFSRLYDPHVEPFTCSLRLFLQESGRLTEVQKIDLGERMVFEKIRPLSIRKNDPDPVGTSISFQSSDGSVEEWVFFTKTGYTRLTLKETFSVQPVVEDIDRDGVLDVLFFEKGYEEGMGYETYILWYKWDGKGYSEYKTINVLRNLKTFLSECFDLLSRQEWDKFVRYGLSDDRSLRYKRVGIDSKQIVSRLFTSLQREDETEEELRLDDLHIDKLIYPELFESPFQKNGQGELIFPLRIRAIAEEGEFVFGTYLLMEANPFEKNQFTFVMGNENVHN